MWNVLFLFFITTEFGIGSSLELMRAQEKYHSNPVNKPSDTIQKEIQITKTFYERRDYSTEKVPSNQWIHDGGENGDLLPLVYPHKVQESVNHEEIHEMRPTVKDNKFDILHLKVTEAPDVTNKIGSPTPENTNEYKKSLHPYENEYELNQDDDYQIPRPRKRRPPQNYEYTSRSISTPISYFKVEEVTPDTAHIKEKVLADIHEISGNFDLKALLKMQRFHKFSLSEILQQRNLSLTDLLKRKIDVIDVLKTSNSKEVNDEMHEFSETNEKTAVTTTKSPVLKDKPLTLATTQSIDHDKILTNEKKQSVNNVPLLQVTKIRTTTLDRNAEQHTTPLTGTRSGPISEMDEIMEYSDFLKESKNKAENVTPNNIEPFQADVTSFLNIKNVLTSTEFSVQSAFKDVPTSVPIDIDTEYQNEEAINASESTNMDRKQEKQFSDDIPLLNHRIFVSNNKIYEEMISEIEPQARAEILELFASTSTAKKLENLLKSRNMSLDELISLRQRGSSRVHLAQINPSRALDSKSEELALAKSQRILLNANSTENRNFKKNTQTRPTTEASFATDNLRRKSYDEKSREDSLHLIDLLSVFESLPFAILAKQKTTNDSLKSTQADDNENYDKNDSDSIKTKTTDINFMTTTLSHIDIIQEIDKHYETLPTTNIDTTDTSLVTSKNENIQTFYKIRPSIIASGTILGVTIFGFFLIFIVLKIHQKQKFAYKNSFSRTVFQVPAMNTRKLSNSSSLNTIVANIVATSTPKRKTSKRAIEEINNDMYDCKCDIESDSLDANDSWNTVPNYIK